MVLRFLFRYLANNEQLVNRLADSKPIRRAAQMVVYFFTVGKEAAANHQLSAGRLRSVMQKFKAELEEAKHEMKKAKDEFKKDGFQNMKGGRGVSVVFVGSNWPSEHKWKVSPHQSLLDCIKQYFIVPPEELISRILSSFIPPFMGDMYRQVHVDFLGPALAVIFMAILLNYGHAFKLPSAVASTSPTVFLICYVVFMPLLAYVLGRVGRAAVTFTEMAALLGYGMFGHIFTLVASLALYDEQSNVFFFLSLIIFGGFSTLRVATVLLASIPLPVARLTVCSLVASLQLLSLIFVHFAYMHKTFVYGGGKLQMRP